MNCPYCGNEMKEGAFVLNRYIDWMPAELKKAPIITSFSYKTMRVLRKGEWQAANDHHEIEAYHCPACRKFIFDGMLNE